MLNPSVYGRFFKLYLYTAIAPVPLSSFAGEPSSNIGKSFLKSYAKRFGDNDLFGELFGKVLSKCVEKKVIKADVVFMDSTHMKASANKNKATSKEIEEQGKHYQDELEAEINEARMELGKAPLKKKKK